MSTMTLETMAALGLLGFWILIITGWAGKYLLSRLRPKG